MVGAMEPHQLVGSAGSVIHDQSPLPLPGTPSPGSSSASTGSGSGSGKSTDTIKRGASPSSVKQVRIQESVSTYSINHKKSVKDSPTDEATTAATDATTTTTRKSVDFYESHKPQTKTEDSSISTKYGETSKARNGSTYSSLGATAGKSAISTLSTEDYKAMRNKSSTTSSSSSSQATVLSAGSTATSAATTSSDDSDDLVSYKSSASTNALLAQSQAMTTSQLMSKYLKREPRVQFTPIKSPDSPSPPDSDNIPKGTYHLTGSSSKTSSSTGAISKYTTTPSNISASLSPSSALSSTSAYGTSETNLTNTSSSHKVSSPSRQISSSISSGIGKDSVPPRPPPISTTASSTSIVSTGRRLFDSLATATANEKDTKSGTASTTSTTNYTNDTKNLVGSYISNKQQSSEYKSLGSTLFGGGNGSSTSPFVTNGSSNGAHNAMHLYGTLPKNGTSGGNGSSGSGLFSSTGSSAFYSATSSGAATASSSGVSSMTGSTNSYDFYTSSTYASSSVTASTTRPFANGSSSYGSNGAGNYHTLGTYRVQYAATNPFLDAFDAPASGNGNGNNGSNNHGSGEQSQQSHSSHRTSLLTAFHSSDSKNGSDEYDDLK
ncbi:rho GTPase-activating protein 100F-like [Teleopsis dalmanni]|uniref:rho GTPase-activating protein 100F-like n=1 Tax=Teleopsis dalmanni TaxID=139649 RepID=UPI0018CED458|nr:rho GTPase-activating protein 100F-like [Teleopsis dalmanni]